MSFSEFELGTILSDEQLKELGWTLNESADPKFDLKNDLFKQELKRRGVIYRLNHFEGDAELVLQLGIPRFLKYLDRYLSLVPKGQLEKDSPRRTSRDKEYREMRLQAFHERGCMCEVCSRKLREDNFHFHHLDYYKGDDPNHTYFHPQGELGLHL